MRHILASAALVALAISTPALAADEAATPAFKASGSVALVSDYRFRGVSQSDKGAAIQGGITVGHQSGAYVGFWASNLSGWGTFGGPNLELDLIGGYKFGVGNGTLDVGLTWYVYPGGASKTAFAEPYIKLGGTAGPVSLLAGVAYAPKQQALGNWYFSGASYVNGIIDDEGAKDDNLYLWGDISSGIPDTGITLKAHIGYSDGNPGLGPNGTSVAPTGSYWDWLIGVDYVVGPVTLGVAYVDTDISLRDSAYLLPNFSSTKDGSTIAGSKILFSITGAF
nr:TorF family putative porin [Polymorphobacter sp.]